MVRQKSPLRLDWVDPAVCSLDYRLKLIGRLSYFKELPPESIAQINRLFHDTDMHEGTTVYYEGDEAEAVYLVATGKVKLVLNTSSGREVLLDILHGGEDFGTSGAVSGRAYTESAVAQTDCCILKISATDFDAILTEHPDVTRKVLAVVTRRLAESRDVVKQLSAYPVEQRIASALLRLAGKLGEPRPQGVLIQLPFSRQDLAAMTGSTTETVSRVMSRLAQDGLVKSGRKWITITDEKRLGELARKGAVN